MKEENNIKHQNNRTPNFEKLSNVKDFQELINKIKISNNSEKENKSPNYEKIFPSFKNDNKMHLLLARTYYLKEFDKI